MYIYIYMIIGCLHRVYGKGPSKIPVPLESTSSTAEEGDENNKATSTPVNIQEYLKFETSSKSFKNLPVKNLTSTVDAIILEFPKAMRSFI
jgi:hypothetical protein